MAAGIETTLGVAQAKLRGEATTDGIALEGQLGVRAGSAKGTAGFSFFGVKVEGSGEATGGSAHIGGGVDFKPFGGSDNSKIGAEFNIGALVGFGLSFSISW